MDQPELKQSGAKPLAAAAAALPQPLHQSDADDDDENVKQLDECSSLYLVMQVKPLCLLLLSRFLKP